MSPKEIENIHQMKRDLVSLGIERRSDSKATKPVTIKIGFPKSKNACQSKYPIEQLVASGYAIFINDFPSK